ncbi:MAG: hypothetical protein JXA97_05790 [Anaerolineales bacterium]|nr:hypothetical protein [Anaerolineales bacterium]
MNEIMLFLERQQGWIYATLGIVAVFYFRQGVFAYMESRRARFRLESEKSRRKLMIAGSMLALICFGALLVFIMTSILSPALPASARLTAVPTVNLLASPEVLVEAGGAQITITPLTDLDPNQASCSNPDAIITWPLDGAQLSGVVEILGTANIDNFAFYKIEYRSIAGEGTWRAIMAGTNLVCEDFCEVEELLGTWDTSLVSPAEYALRLVVSDTSGNAPQPCEIRVSVTP